MFKLRYALITLFLISSPSQGMENDNQKIAQIIMIRGEAHGKLPSGEVLALKKETWLSQGTIVKTANKSMLKLLFIDKSTLNLGPDSQIVISKFNSEKAGVIDLLRGSIRSKVSKDYLQIKEKDNSKLIIKTPSAAMGVRGTDFTVSFEEDSEVTKLQVWEGEVIFMETSKEILQSFKDHLDTLIIDQQLNKIGLAVKGGEEVRGDIKDNKGPDLAPIPDEKMKRYQDENKKLEEKNHEAKIIRQVLLPGDIPKEIQQKNKEEITHEKPTADFRHLPPTPHEIEKMKEQFAQNPELATKGLNSLQKEVQHMSDKEIQQISTLKSQEQATIETHRQLSSDLQQQHTILKDGLDTQRRIIEIHTLENIKKPDIPHSPPSGTNQPP